MRLSVLLLAAAACAHAQAAPQPEPAASRDPLLHATWAKVTPAPPATDAEFLRRATLDLAGRVPTRQEAAAYLDDRDPLKKAKLVERLLASPDYAEHFADVYMTLLVGRDFKLSPENRDLSRQWLVEAFTRNQPWDRLATQIISARGELSQHGEIGFLLAHAARGGSPEAVAGATARIFLGLQIQCAQCHDHPYDPRWKQEDFYGLVAYFARTRARPSKELGPCAQRRVGCEDVKTLMVFDAPFGQARMKKHGSDQEVVVLPKFLGRSERGDRMPRRDLLARDVVGSDLFAKALVNRTWALFFGRGIVDPVDDLGAENDESHPPLLNALAADFRAGGYDLRRLYKTIVLSDAYARSTQGGSADAEKVFARAAVRPLQAEQLFRSLLGATNLEQAALRRVDHDVLEKRLEQGLRQFVFVFGDDEMGEVDRASGTIPQALLLFNGELTNRGVLAAPGGTLRAILDESRDPQARLEQIFLAGFGRRPTPAEVARYLPGLKKPADYEDLFFAVLTSTEFASNH